MGYGFQGQGHCTHIGGVSLHRLECRVVGLPYADTWTDLELGLSGIERGEYSLLLPLGWSDRLAVLAFKAVCEVQDLARDVATLMNVIPVPPRPI